MQIVITIAAAPRSKELLLDATAALERDLRNELELRWLAADEALDLILQDEKTPTPRPSPQGEREQHLSSSAAISASGYGNFERQSHQGEIAGRGEDEAGLSHIRRTVEAAIGNRPLDWCVQPAEGRKKRMLIADMDSTVIGQECLDEMADLKGIKPEIAALTERAMRGELDFEAALNERIRLLAGLTPADLKHVLDEHITLNPGAQTLVHTMNAHGAHTVLVSGGFTFFTHAVAARAGFAKDRANVFLWEGGRLAGVAQPVLGREAKLSALKEEAGAHGIALAEAIAVGDGANDLAMLKAAGLGVAYHAKPVVAAEADAEVKHTSLATLLFFQGYSRNSFVS
jgi:phosphoserine phosphatase